MKPRRASLDAFIARGAYASVVALVLALLGFLAVLLANVVNAIATSMMEAPASTLALLLVLAFVATVIALSGRTKATQPPLRRDTCPVDKPIPWPGSGVI